MKWCTEGGQRPKPLEGAAAAAAAERGVGGGIGLLFMRVSHTRGRGGGWRVSIQVSSSNCNTDVWFKLRYGFCVQTAIQLLPLGLSPRLSPASLSSHLNLQQFSIADPPPLGRPPPCLCRQRRQVHEEAARHFKLHHLPHRIASSEWVKAHDGNEKLVATPPPPPM